MSHVVLKPPSIQTSIVRAEVALLNGMPDDFPWERAAVDRVPRALVASINAEQIPFGEWQRAALTSSGALALGAAGQC